MAEEYESIMKNEVWDVVPRPKGEICGNFEVDIQDQAWS